MTEISDDTPEAGGPPLDPSLKKVSMNKTITLIRAKGVEAMEVKFLWYPYIPAGMITFLEGDPGVGKSWITVKLASDVSRGLPLPGQKEAEALPASSVLIFTGEEPLEAIRSRLEKVGADVDNVWLSDSLVPFSPKGMADLEEMIKDLDAKVVILDPLQSFISSDADMSSAKDMQKMLKPLADVAKRTGASMIIIRHLRKSGGKNAKHAGIGSIALTGIARSVIQAGSTRAGNTVMSHVKYNYSPRGDTLRYSILDGTFAWEGTYASAEDTEPKISRTPSKATMEVQNWLHEALSGGARPMVDVLEEGMGRGFTRDRINQSKKGIATSKKVGKIWYWSLEGRENEGVTPPIHAKVQRTPEEDLAIKEWEALSPEGRELLARKGTKK